MIETGEGRCGCGCKAPVTRSQKQGHDARFHSKLLAAHREGAPVAFVFDGHKTDVLRQGRTVTTLSEGEFFGEVGLFLATASLVARTHSGQQLFTRERLQDLRRADVDPDPKRLQGPLHRSVAEHIHLVAPIPEGDRGGVLSDRGAAPTAARRGRRLREKPGRRRGCLTCPASPACPRNVPTASAARGHLARIRSMHRMPGALRSGRTTAETARPYLPQGRRRWWAVGGQLPR